MRKGKNYVQLNFENYLQEQIKRNNIPSEDVLNFIMKSTSYQKIIKKHGKKITQGNDGRWRTRLPDGKLVAKTKYEDLLKVLSDYYSILPTSCTLKTLYPKWFEFRKKEVRATTLSKTQYAWNTYLKDSEIVNRPIEEITRMEFNAFFTEFLDNNPMTKKRFASEIKPIINGLLNFAIDLDIISINKFAKINIKETHYVPKKKTKRGEDVLSAEQVQLILAEAYKDSKLNHTAIPLSVPLFLYTGIRDGELCALKFGDFDFEESVLTVQRSQVTKVTELDGTYKSSGYEIVDYAKTGTAIREVILPSVVYDLVNQIRKLNAENGFTVSDDDYLFRRNNQYARKQNDDLGNNRVFDTLIRKYCKILDLKYQRSPHDLRRTYVTINYNNGVPITALQQQCGHADVATTLGYLRDNTEYDSLKDLLNKNYNTLKAAL